MDRHWYDAGVEVKTQSEERVIFSVVLLTLLALLLRLFHLGHQNFWIDEMITLQQGLAPGHGLWEQFIDDYHNPLVTVVVTWLTHLGRSEALLRLPGAILGGLSIPLIYLLGRELAGVRTGLLAALLLAVHPFHIFHSQELRGYGWMVFFGLAAAVVAIGARKHLSVGRAVALTALGVATSLSSLEGLFWMGGLALACWVAGWMRRGERLRWLVVFALMVVVMTPWWAGTLTTHHAERLLPGEETGEPMRGSTTMSPWAVPYAVFVLSVGNTVGPRPLEIREIAESSQDQGPTLPRRHWPAVAGVGSLALVLMVAGIKSLGRRTWVLLAWVAVPLVVALVLAARNIKPFNPRYVIAVLPAYLLILAAGIDALPRRAGLYLLIGWLAFTGLGVYRYHFVPRYGREDVRGAVRLIESRESGQDFILVPTVYDVFQWYYRGHDPVYPYWWSHSDSSLEKVEERLAAMEPTRRFIWYVRCRPWHDDPNGWLLAALKEQAVSRALFELPGVEVFLFERGTAP